MKLWSRGTSKFTDSILEVPDKTELTEELTIFFVNAILVAAQGEWFFFEKFFYVINP